MKAQSERRRVGPTRRWKSDIARRVLDDARRQREPAPQAIGWPSLGFPTHGGLGWQPRLLAKRVFDVSVVVLVAPLWLPLVGVIALAVKATAPRAPVLFSQARTGMHGKPFRMHKFRTMVPNAEELKEKLRHLNELAWPDFKIKNDPRITRLGRFLRQTSLDELPQLFNVLRGEMSLVGPRPTSFFPDTYEPWQKTRLSCLPGVTGPWQVTSRGEADFAARSRLDIQYLHRGSLVLDLLILAQTVGAVFGRKGF